MFKFIRILNESKTEKDINLSSFKIKEELNPNFWDENKKLNPEIRLQLLSIVDDFIKSIELNSIKIDDIIITGSIANYNWSKYSDVDLHIITNFKKIFPKKPEFVKDYFNNKKELWKINHKSLNIFGFTVELYVQDTNEVHNSSGQYSVENDKWVVEPKPFEDYDFDKDKVRKKAVKLINDIDDLTKKINEINSKSKLEKLYTKLEKLFDKLKNDRRKGLEKDGEFHEWNIVYKVIRRTEYLDKIFVLKNKIYDKINSISE